MTDADAPLTFDALALDPRLLAALGRLGFTTPTPIQAEAIGPLRDGRDVIGRARTGSGKTAAYGLPLLHRIHARTGNVRALILAPTRELALQVTEALRDLGSDLPIDIATLYGGAPYPPQLKALSRGVPIVVGTPGRVIDHMERGSLDLSHIEVLVLDEADEMLRMGFLEAVEAVLAACPEDRQIALLSATMPEDIQRIAGGHLSDPVELSLDDDGPRVDHIDQRWIKVAQRDKLDVLQRLLLTGPEGATVVFVRTRAACAELADALAAQGVAVDALNGDMPQAARERVVQRLRSGGIGVVIATDVAARGLDVEHIARVINVDLPADTETYVHRIGRTARAGRGGEAITLVTSAQRRHMSDIARTLGVDIRKDEVPGDADIARHQQRRLAAALSYARDNADMSGATAWIAAQVAEGAWTLDDLAAAAVAHLAAVQGVPLSVPAAPARVERTERPDRAERAERSEGPDTAAPAARTGPASRCPRPDGPPALLFLPIGERQGVRPGDLVGALVNQAGVPAEPIGRIVVDHRKAFVELPASIVDYLVDTVRVMEIRHTEIRLARAHEGSLPAPEGRPGPAGRNARPAKGGFKRFKGPKKPR